MQTRKQFPVEGSIHNAKVIILAFLAISLVLQSPALAQTDSLGWKGKAFIPLSLFVDETQWNPGASSVATSSIETDDSCVYLHWKFSAENEFQYAQGYQYFDTTFSLSGIDIIGIDVMGSSCGENRNVQIKFEHNPILFEHSAIHAIYRLDNLARITRWGEHISIMKNQFGSADPMNWDSVFVLSFEVNREQRENDTLADSGVVAFRFLSADSIGSWTRADTFETLLDTGNISTIKEEALEAILGRQDTITGLFHTWYQDNTSYLYGHGLVLKILSIEGTWTQSQPADSIALAAERLALFLVNNQEKQGFWPRAWNTHTGVIISHYEDDSTIWMGDFPWIITGLQNYYNKSGDIRVKTAIEKARLFLYNCIGPDGRLYTMNPFTYKKKEVVSAEAYAAAIMSLFELGDSTTANKMLDYIDNATWDNDLEYWKEASTSPRVVLFANTWLSQLMKKTWKWEKAVKALSLTGNVLATKGPGNDIGLDGVAPLAVWYEGTLSYICAGGPGSRFLFSNVLKHRYPDGSVPHYNDSLPSMAGIWAVEWSSLDGTAWLYFAASHASPFERLTTPLPVESTEEPKKAFIHYMGWFNDSVAENGIEPLMHWNCGYANTPEIGEYDFKRWPLLAYHILLAKSCGIDGLVVNIKDKYDEQSLDGLISTMNRLKAIDSSLLQFTLAISYDDQGMDNKEPFDTAIEKLTFLRDTILKGFNDYLYYYDKPAVFVYNYPGRFLSAKDYRHIADSIFNETPPLIAWNECRKEEVDYLNACYPWVQPAPSDAWDTLNGRNWGKEYLEFFYNEVNADSVLTKLDMVCGGVWPGFDNRENHCWNFDMDRWMDRRNGVVYDSTWSFVHNYEGLTPLKWVIIETWNDFNEGSEIEPTFEHGHQYLDSTIVNINKFKNTAVDLDENRYVAARQLYLAGGLLEQHQRDSIKYYPIYEHAVVQMLNQEFVQSIQSTDSILNLDPVINIVKPGDSIVHKYSDTIIVRAIVDDTDNSEIVTVMFYINDIFQSDFDVSIPDSVYTINWIDPDVNIYKITAKAVDELGGEDSDTIQLRINTIPEITIVAPEDSSNLPAGTDTIITIYAMDSNGIVDSVIVYVNQTLLGKADQIDAETFNIQFPEVQQNSTYIILAQAYDNDGAFAMSDTITLICFTNILRADLSDAIEVFPIPADNKISISIMDNELFGEIILQLMNTSGTKVRQWYLKKQLPQIQADLNVEGLLAGVYYLILYSHEYIGSIKIVIK